MKKVVRKIALFLLVVSMGCLPLSSVNAYEVDNNSISVNSLVVQPRSFQKTISINLSTSGFTHVLSDSNWWSERYVTISFNSSSGAQGVQVYVKDKNGTSLGTRTLSIGDATVYTLPVGGGAFSVYAKSVGSNSHVNLGVGLD